MTQIHPTAIIDPKAELADSVKIGPYALIEGNVVIDAYSEIHSHALIASGARIGKHCIIHHSAAVATVPQDLKFAGEETLFEIGDHTVIREFCDLNRGTHELGKSVIGPNSFLMAYTHVAHDCLVGSHVILANGVQLGGHVKVGDWTVIGGMVPVHQFCKIGAHAMIGGGYRVVQDVPPYILAAEEPLEYRGLNLVGLRRRGFSKETIRALQRSYRYLYRAGLNRSQALEKIRTEIEPMPEVQAVIDFINESTRGVIR